MWAPEIPFETIEGDPEKRRTAWLVSNCPLKLINYESLTRDVELAADERVGFDVVVLDEAQRIKNRDSKTAQAVCALRRERSWALTGTPIENHADDLVNLFGFIDPGRIPAGTPPRRLPQYTADSILRRTKDLVMKGIYKFDGEEMTVCTAMPGKDRPNAFKTAKDSGQILIGYKRDKK